MLEATPTARQFLGALAASRRNDLPYRHWLLDNMLPSRMVDDIVALPVAAPEIGDTQGRRETHNSTRWFFGQAEQARFPVCRDLAAALQSREVVLALEQACGVTLGGSSLRIEYCLDTDGFWLEPHTDIGAKYFTMLVYLTDPAPGEQWGTDIYASATQFAGTAPSGRNHGLIFIPGADTWHGFAKRKITGVRRSLIVNYVTPAWRSRHELAFPETPVSQVEN
ncbi:2OG-Fe(II) oxygenase [Acidocella sp.]|uniref:2OG-Fe(II) oxygenase n=1 Tax=Acidocella sp. TaxID=50710 RepID=UPI002631A69C|nr:2OG-Fe(II) oxygenase [Acidocella sp.]